MMRFSVLGSGSKGNCVFVECGTTAILIDGGFSGKEIASRLAQIDRDISCLKAIFVTHEHRDHISGVGVMSRRCKIPVFANKGTFHGGKQTLGKLFKRCEFQTGDQTDFQDIAVRSFAISHDTADPVGFVVSNGTRSLGVCTDTGIGTRLISRRLSGCDGLVLEFNHDPEMLKAGPYPWSLKQRVGGDRGHLSNEVCAQLLNQVKHDELQTVVLMHLSGVNNHPDIVRRHATGALAGSRAQLHISKQDQPTPLIPLI